MPGQITNASGVNDPRLAERGRGPRRPPEPSLRWVLTKGTKLPTELTFEELEAGGYIICGSPATVRDKLRVFADELRAGIVCSGMNGGSQEATLEMMELFAREVMPHFREDAAVDETAVAV